MERFKRPERFGFARGSVRFAMWLISDVGMRLHNSCLIPSRSRKLGLAWTQPVNQAEVYALDHDSQNRAC